MTILSVPPDLRELLAADGSIDLSLNEPGHGPRVRMKLAWWGDMDDELVLGNTLAPFVAARDDWNVLHSVYFPSLDVDVDAMVLGPRGALLFRAVYAYDAPVRVSGDVLTVDGRRRSTIVDTRMAAMVASSRLANRLGHSVPVRAVVVPVGAGRVHVRRPARDIAVVTPARLLGWMNKLPAQWSDETVARAFEVARRSSTWDAA